MIYKIPHILNEFILRKEGMELLFSPLWKMLDTFLTYHPWQYLDKNAQDILVSVLVTFNSLPTIKFALQENMKASEEFPEQLVRALVDAEDVSEEIKTYLNNCLKAGRLGGESRPPLGTPGAK